MASLSSEFKCRQWQRDGYLITTDPTVIPLDQLIDIFNSPEFYWASAMPRDHMQAALDHSLCFTLFRSDPEDEDGGAGRLLLGFARCVTDYATFAYLTDVWVDPAAQGRGLGSWLVRCVREVVDAMPHLRRCMLFTSSWERSVPFYQRLMGMEIIPSTPGRGLVTMERKGRGHPRYGSEGSDYS